MPVSKAFFCSYPDQIATSRTECGYGGSKKTPRKKHLCPIRKAGFCFWRRGGSAAVSSHWRGQRGEFPVLHHSDGCVQLHYVRAAGSPGCRGRGSRCSAPIGPGVPAKVSGSGPRWDTGLALRPAGLAGQRGAAVVSQMIYRGLGWREY